MVQTYVCLTTKTHNLNKQLLAPPSPFCSESNSTLIRTLNFNFLLSSLLLSLDSLIQKLIVVYVFIGTQIFSFPYPFIFACFGNPLPHTLCNVYILYPVFISGIY